VLFPAAIPEWLYRESILTSAFVLKGQGIPAGACPSMIEAGAGMTKI
jgi:hypothetical protein